VDIEYLLEYGMLNYSNHYISDTKYINISSLMLTLNALRKVKYVEEYNINNTTCQTFPLKESTMNYYQTKGVCKHPIVVTDDNHCLDGRHRVAFHKQNNVFTLPAYVVPRSYVNKFIESV